MKYNTNKKMTRGAKRTLNDFMCTMFTMLSEKNFEEITVGELCKCANYPRATFYNYFDDILPNEFLASILSNNNSISQIFLQST